MAPMKQINASDRVVQTIQDNAVSAIKAIETATQINVTLGAQSTTSISGPFTGGNLITGVTLTSGQDNLIAHKLGRMPKIYVITNLNVNSVVWSPVSTQLANQSSSAQYLNLRASVTAVVDVWVA